MEHRPAGGVRDRGAPARVRHEDARDRHLAMSPAVVGAATVSAADWVMAVSDEMTWGEAAEAHVVSGDGGGFANGRVLGLWWG
jgi:hypothetical protein